MKSGLYLRNRLVRGWAAAFALVILLVSPTLAAEKTLLLYGDSLLAGYGLSQNDAFMGQLQAALDAQNIDVLVINASVSGDTTSAGLERLDWALVDTPDAVLLGLGANDMLQGVSPEIVRDNLSQILAALAAKEVPVLIAGMMANRALGPDYVKQFDAIYPDLASKYGAILYPFYLDGVALDPALNQPDMRHPNAAGVKKIIAAIMPYVISLLDGA
ncbi:arylesterase [Devosia rhodophyticola]|uniref:Arylesterase n=1 Tax=Devosia rhodophyticola TaxID=3026423 RepID=A0ABY7YYI5_9HYPH|nr:arylesterase [Devosia rhodophyticola]WDR06304.1 arylesterase [Devosia rhodophyticola]